MPKFDIEYRCDVYYVVTIEAETEEEALKKFDNEWYDVNDIVLLDECLSSEPEVVEREDSTLILSEENFAPVQTLIERSQTLFPTPPKVDDSKA